MLSQAVDVVDTERFEKLLLNKKFLGRVCVESELKFLKGVKSFEKLALIFSTKEAVLKALGTGLSDGMTFKDIEYSIKESSVKLKGKALEVLGERKVFISTSLSKGKAFAFCIIE